MTTAQKIWEWINARWDEGRTVYATTYLRSVKITPRMRGCVKLSEDGKSVLVQRGKFWDDSTFCKYTAS